MKHGADGLILTVQGVFPALRGHCSGTDHRRATSKARQKYEWVWTEAGKFSEWWNTAEGKKNILRALAFVSHIFFLYYYKTLQTVANLHTWSGTQRDKETTKIKSIFHPKGINNIKRQTFFSFKQIHSYELIFYYYKKINKSSKEFLMFYEFSLQWDEEFVCLFLFHLWVFSFLNVLSRLSPTVLSPVNRNMKRLWARGRWEDGHGRQSVSLLVCVQASCSPACISSPTRLLLEIHPGFLLQSKSGKPRPSQDITWSSVSTLSSASSSAAKQTEKKKRERLVDFPACTEQRFWRSFWFNLWLCCKVSLQTWETRII